MIDDILDKPLQSFRAGFSLHPDQMAVLNHHLSRLLEDIPAKMILLVDTSGQLVSVLGDDRGMDTTALGSLIAGDLAASQEIARMTGEFQAFQMILREGEKSHIMITEAGTLPGGHGSIFQRGAPGVGPQADPADCLRPG